MKKLILTLIATLVLAGCVSTKTQDVFLKKKISTPKVLAISGVHAPWVYEIIKRLRKAGFVVKRMVSQNVAVERVSSKKTDIYNEASARFILVIHGYAPNNPVTRCFGGGYDFDYINVELIDVKTNETVLYYSNSGFSEKCPPLSGTIFGDITNMIVSAWK